MRKPFIIILAAVLFTLLAMAACNIDATIGIYSEAAQSTPSTDVVIRNYIGSFKGDYYYLTDDGIYKKNGESKEITTLFRSTDTERVVNAYFEEVDADTAYLYVLKDSKDLSAGFPTSLKYYISTDGYTEAHDVSGIYDVRNMLPNGFVWDNMHVYYLENGSAVSFDLTAGVYIDILSAYKSEMTYDKSKDRYAFFSIKQKASETGDETARKYYVLKAGNPLPVINLDITDDDEKKRVYCGFQCLKDDSEFLLLYMNTDGSSNYSYAKKLTSSGIADYVTLTDNMKYSVSQNASFYDPVGDRVVVKCTSYFDEINLSDGKITQRKQQYAANICTADISDFIRKDTSDSNIFIVGTANSFLYSIDMDHPENNPVQL